MPTTSAAITQGTERNGYFASEEKGFRASRSRGAQAEWNSALRQSATVQLRAKGLASCRIHTFWLYRPDSVTKPIAEHLDVFGPDLAANALPLPLRSRISIIGGLRV